MQISKIKITNFRNFRDCEIFLDGDAVIVGENKVGKTNLVYALRLVLDPRLSDYDRKLRIEDFWDGLQRPLTDQDSIAVSVDLIDFEDNADQLAVLSDYLVEANPITARLTYTFRPIPTIDRQPEKEADYEVVCYGGDSADNRFGSEVRSQIPINVLPALRDAEADLSNWRKSPLAPLLRSIASSVNAGELDVVARQVSDANSEVCNLPAIQNLGERISTRLEKMVGARSAVATDLGFTPADPLRLIRSLKLFIDQASRSISDASLGCANLIYLTLLSLDLERQVSEGSRSHTFLAIEEPEAHLHPHLQRLVFRDFFKRGAGNHGIDNSALNVLVTTHSPNIVSVAPLKSLVILRSAHNGTLASSTAKLQLDANEIEDLERYLDVNRGECVFARGILMVEGTAEEYLIPALAQSLGYDFDSLGITVCSVAGTNFEPYVKFFGQSGLDIPFAVLTDLDPVPDALPLGFGRLKRILTLVNQAASENLSEQNFNGLGSDNGIFLNQSTLETELLSMNCHEIMFDVIRELTDNNAAVDRADRWTVNPEDTDPDRFLKDIMAIGKGRYAQRLASKIQAGHCPEYIRRAIEYIIDRVQRA